jgi:hypothetical protein
LAVVWAQVIDPFLQGSRHPVSLAELGIDEVRTCIDEADELFELHGNETDRREMAWMSVGIFREVVAINRGANSVLVLVTNED